ncbi:MAG: site-specific integrase [Cyanobacteria bacterium J06648_11]
MATIRKREGKKGFRWQAGIRRDGKVQWASFRTKGEAQQWARERETAIDQGRYFETPEARRRTLGDAMERYLVEVVPQKRDQRNPTRHVRFWKDRLGNVALYRLRRSSVGDVLDELALTRSAGTVNRYLATIRHALRIAATDWEWLERSPISGGRLARKEPKGRDRYLSEDERVALLTAARESSNSDMLLMVLLAVTTGARWGEIVGLQWSDVSTTQKRAVIRHTKNEDSRSLPLVPQVVDLLRERKRVRLLRDPRVFPSPESHEYNRWRPGWKRVVQAAALEDFRFHDLRHTAASYLAMNGASLNDIAAILGHRTPAMVQRYAHLSDSHIQERVFSTWADRLAEE